jgi:hypothetical protein
MPLEHTASHLVNNGGLEKCMKKKERRGEERRGKSESTYKTHTYRG